MTNDGNAHSVLCYSMMIHPAPHWSPYVHCLNFDKSTHHNYQEIATVNPKGTWVCSCMISPRVWYKQPIHIVIKYGHRFKQTLPIWTISGGVLMSTRTNSQVTVIWNITSTWHHCNETSRGWMVVGLWVLLIFLHEILGTLQCTMDPYAH